MQVFIGGRSSYCLVSFHLLSTLCSLLHLARCRNAFEQASNVAVRTIAVVTIVVFGINLLATNVLFWRLGCGGGGANLGEFAGHPFLLITSVLLAMAVHIRASGVESGGFWK